MAAFFISEYGIGFLESVIYPEAYADSVNKYSIKYGLDRNLVFAVIKTESNFVRDAHSGKARGLMQLTDDTAEWVCKKLDINKEVINLNSPDDNIKMGCFYLKYLIERYNGDIDVALAAYNAGPANVDRWLLDKKYSEDGKKLKSIPYKETREYVLKVNKQWKKYKEIY